MAYNLPFEALDGRLFTVDVKGDNYSGSQKPVGSISGTGNAYAWAIRWSDYNAPAALYKLLANNVTVKVATSPVETLSGELYERGTLFIPMGSVNKDVSVIEKALAEITSGLGLNVYKLSTGDNNKIDLGSPTLINIEKPRIAIFTEDGVNGLSAGQLWHLFDIRYNIPLASTPVCSVFPISQGRIIATYNNPVFRAYWRGSNRFIANAIFFGKTIRFSSGRE